MPTHLHTHLIWQMRQPNFQHQTLSLRELLHILQESKGASSYNHSELKTSEKEDDSMKNEKEEETSTHGLLVVLPAKSWGPSSKKSKCLKSVLSPEPVQYPAQEDSQDDAPKKRLSRYPPSFTWQPIFLLQPLGFSTVEVGPKALSGAGLMVHGVYCEAGPKVKKTTPKNKALGTPKRASQSKGPPRGMGQLQEINEKNQQRIYSLYDGTCQKRTLSTPNRKCPKPIKNNIHQPVQKKNMGAKSLSYPKHEVRTNIVQPWFQTQYRLQPKATLINKHHLQNLYAGRKNMDHPRFIRATEPQGGAKCPLAPRRGG